MVILQITADLVMTAMDRNSIGSTTCQFPKGSRISEGCPRYDVRFIRTNKPVRRTC